MSNDAYEEHLAKEELLRLDGILTEPVMLIGGLAVQQYVLERQSKDLDIVCDLQTQKKLLSNAYGDPHYQKDQRQTDLRPVYVITDSIKGCKVYLGAKILEREKYPFIDYEIIFENSRPFIYNDSKAENIRIPEPHSLAFSKLISYIARRGTQKGVRDLEDFVKLTNHRDFSLNNLITLTLRLKATDFIAEFFENTKLNEQEINLLSISSPVRVRQFFPVETFSYIAEHEKKTIPKFAPVDANFKLKHSEIIFEYNSLTKMRYTKSKQIVALKNKVGAFYDQYHWTGDPNVSMKSNNQRHVIIERQKRNVWRTYEVDFQKILKEGDEEEVSIFWELTNDKGDFVPFISSTIDCKTDSLSIKMDASSLNDKVESAQLFILPRQGMGEPVEVIDIESDNNIFEYNCKNPMLFYTYEMRWNLVS